MSPVSPRPQPEKQPENVPQSQRSSSPPPKTSSSGRRVLLGALSVLVAAGAWWMTNTGPILGTSRGDHVPQEEQQRLIESFSQVRNVELQPVNLADPVEREKAVQSLDLPAQEAKKIIQEADQGEVKLAWITLWDNAAEDGDVVQIQSNGYTRAVTIAHAPRTFVIPYIMKGQVVITGVHDGGGGITVSAKTAGGAIPFPSIAEGQKVTLPLK